MASPPALLVQRGLRADAKALGAALTGGGHDRALLCAAAAELTELAVAHVRSATRHALPGLAPDAAVRAGAQLHDVELAADAAGDAAAVLASAGLDGGDRGDARRALARRVAALASALPSYAECRGPGWDVAALQCAAPPWLVLGSALRDVADEQVPDTWRPLWRQVQPELHRSALHRLARPVSHRSPSGHTLSESPLRGGGRP